MKRIVFTMIFTVLSGFSAFGQNENPPCPTIRVNGPNEVIRPGELMFFSASIENEIKSYDFKYKWAVDKGKIIKGQGTPKIEVDTSDYNDTIITATLEIVNLPSRCRSSFSEKGVVAGGHPHPPDEYGKLTLKDELVRIDNFLIELISNPQNQGCIVLSYKEKEPVKKAEKHVRKLVKHIKYRGYPAERIIFLFDKNLREDKTVLWRLPECSKLTWCEDCEIIKDPDMK